LKSNKLWSPPWGVWG